MSDTRGNIEAIYPLTPVQDGILFHTLLEPDAPLYIQQYSCTITGPLDREAFVAAWRATIARHQPLRTLLTWERRDQPLQIVRGVVEPEWTFEDWRAEPPSAFSSAFDRYLEADRIRGFGLSVAPLMRFSLIQIDEAVHHFVWTHHHIVVDGWSLGLVVDDVFTIYAAIAAGAEPQLDPAPSYRDYVRWLKSHETASAESFWTSQLEGFGAATPLPFRPGSEQPPRHTETKRRISVALGDRLRALARDQGVTLNTIFQAAWALVLSRYSGEDDVVFGATFSGRPPDLDGSLEMVGLFINTLPVRLAVEQDASVASWLQSVQRRVVDLSSFESTPLSSVQRWSEIRSGEPLFDSLLVFENVPVPETSVEALAVSDVRYLQRSNYPLAVLVLPDAEIELIALFDETRLDQALVGELLEHFVTSLGSLAEGGDRKISELSFFSDRQLEELMVRWNDTARPLPDGATIHELIEKAAADGPDRVAVVDAAGRLTYDELWSRSGDAARALRSLGVDRGDVVGVLADRHAATVAAVVAVLRTGAAYLPIDTGLPAARIGAMLADASAVAVVGPATSDWPHSGLPELRLGDEGSIAGIDSTGSDTQPTSPQDGAGPEDLAYVIYTSGSTGTPKGVAVTHRNLVASTHARIHEYGETVDSFLLLSPLIFDSSVAGLFSSLTSGAGLVLPAPRMEQDVHHLAELIDAHSVTHTLALPSLYELLLELPDAGLLQSLRLVMVAGEPCPPSLVDLHAATLPEAMLVNEYGPTEATVWCTAATLHPRDGEDEGDRVSIGRPIANAQVYLLDSMLRPVPVGAAGELCVAGAGLARGYVGRPDLTADRFVEVDLPLVGPTRVYRTGDLARYRFDGSIDLLGRMDHQVKVRGQRIELGEIEAVLERHPAVRSAAVVARATDESTTTLHAFVESPDDTTSDELRDHVARLLPNTMVPASVTRLADMPKGATGKIDRQALPEPPSPAEIDTESFVEPSGEVESTLAAIWQEVLGIDRVGARDDFFRLGGDSILSIRVIARAHKAGIVISPKQFFDDPTIGGLSRLVE